MEKTKRAAVWSSYEIDALCEAIEPVYCKLFGRHSNEITESVKSTMWQAVTDAVNSVGLNNRSLKACKEKWKYFKSEAKCAWCDYKRKRDETGGGEQPDRPPVKYAKVYSMVPVEVLDGLAGVER